LDEFSISLMRLPQDDAAQNILRLRAMAESIAEVPDVMLLPERWAGRAEEAETAAALDALSEICSGMGCFAVSGGMPWNDGTERVLRSWVIDDRGCRIFRSDRPHLAGEGPRACSPADWRAIFSIGEVTAATLSGYDLMFPEYCRQLSLAGARVFLVSAAWPAEFDYSLDFVVKNCAFVNQSYVAVSSLADAHGRFGGESMAVSPWGKTITPEARGEGVTSVRFRLSEIEKCAEKIPLERDRRDDIYRMLS
jgi:predicted amidohydrolase